MRIADSDDAGWRMAAPEEILSYWFGAEADDQAVAARQARLWWSKDDAIDGDIRQRFAGLLPPPGTPADVARVAPSPRHRLALVILLDQMTRNMFRGSAAMFACDPLARRVAELALRSGDESCLRPIERVFLYLPFEHAEDLSLQDLAVVRFAALCEVVPAAQRPLFADYLDYARRHRDIIARFGRFPHRNAILGRESTQDERDFLAQPGSSF